MTSIKPLQWLKRLFARRAEQTGVSPFHAVEIRCTTNACQAALDTRAERFLSANPPLLPLDQCDRPDRCQCRYQHHKDRRGDPRRVEDARLPANDDSEQVEQRHVKGRRSEDVTKEAEPTSVSEDSYYEYVGNTIRDASPDAGESLGVDPYNSGSFDKSKSWK